MAAMKMTLETLKLVANTCSLLKHFSRTFFCNIFLGIFFNALLKKFDNLLFLCTVTKNGSFPFHIQPVWVIIIPIYAVKSVCVLARACVCMHACVCMLSITLKKYLLSPVTGNKHVYSLGQEKALYFKRFQGQICFVWLPDVHSYAGLI